MKDAVSCYFDEEFTSFHNFAEKGGNIKENNQTVSLHLFNISLYHIICCQNDGLWE